MLKECVRACVCITAETVDMNYKICTVYSVWLNIVQLFLILILQVHKYIIIFKAICFNAFKSYNMRKPLNKVYLMSFVIAFLDLRRNSLSIFTNQGVCVYFHSS